ncbi:hypothetical protein F4553_004417 [Allocatelliglobosispora scoriae]|uniref:DUF11 domain-containing protein n=1 Tax=Allocatelliglobosispora scoriae TaxID=643052 RepID=A0A841BUB1_9ACTN|nr:DUF11 domain-containing protein [Allocatelliglobosispora scoriae]MBB5871038.1 hypothetical protein [Allocatelliglobosispora scoriae]
MSDFDRDELLLTGAFEEFTTGSTPKINAEGTAAVRKRVAKRRRNRAILLVLLTVLAVGVPVAVYATSGRDKPTNPDKHAAGASPSVSASASAAPASPSAAPPPGPSGVTRDLLQLSTITVPDWRFQGDTPGRCMSGPMKLSAPPPSGMGSVQLIGSVVDANLDADPALEAAAILECSTEQNVTRQIVAFERDSSGRILTLGQVMRGFPTDLVRRTSAGGGLRVDMQNVSGCCDVSPEVVQRQQRDYAWNGREYVQIEGPTSFPPHPHVTDLKVTEGAELSFGPVTGAKRVGTVKITVTNLGKVTSSRFLLSVAGNLDATLKACVGSRCYRTENGLPPIIDGIAAGKKVTYTVTVTVGADAPPAVTVPVTVTSIGANDTKSLPDPNPANNKTTAVVVAW